MHLNKVTGEQVRDAMITAGVTLERAAFEAHLSTLPEPMQATIRGSMARGESNSWAFWQTAWLASAAAEREACAKSLDLKASDLRLMAGEMNAGELRTVTAVLDWLKVRMRGADRPLGTKEK